MADSLKDELLADLENDLADVKDEDDLDGVSDDKEIDRPPGNVVQPSRLRPQLGDSRDEEENHVLGFDEVKLEDIKMSEIDDVEQLATLMYSPQMTLVLQGIDRYAAQTHRRIMGIIEQDPEYQLIVQASNVAMDIDNEIRLVVKFVRDHYVSRFPELEHIVSNPLDYVRTVKLIGNEDDLVHMNLKSVVPSATAMSIAVVATTTNGQPLLDDQLKQVYKACDMALALESAKIKILSYVQSRITYIAPNLSAITGAVTAAKLIGVAGGITSLAKYPSCNVPALGKKSQVAVGFAKLGDRHQGFLYNSDLIQSVPHDLRVRAQRIVSGKVILAARIDSVHESASGAQGFIFRAELEKKLEKLSEPPELKDVKALPAPDDPKRKRRGGKKVRKAKEQYAITELQKLRNRMAFGKEEAEVAYGDETEGMGMIGQDTGSSVRGPQIDKRTRAKLPKPRMKGGQLVGPSALMQIQNKSSGGTISGMQSSLSFSSVQGIELPSLNVDALRKAQEDNKWFKGGIFSQIKEGPGR